MACKLLFISHPTEGRRLSDLCLSYCMKVDTEAADDDSSNTEQPSDEVLKTEHDVMDVQQVDSVQSIVGTSDEHDGQEVCLLVCLSVCLSMSLSLFCFSISVCSAGYRNR